MTQTAETEEIGTRGGPIQQAIHQRRSIRKFTDEPVDRAALQRLVDAAVQAPNHRLTRPWRFFILDKPGAAREKLTQLAEDMAFQAQPEPRDEGARQRARNKSQEVATVPVLVLAYSKPGKNEEETHENYAAVACALQNFQLAATDEGLVAGWSTGGIVKHTDLPATIGAEPDWEVVGALYVGHPAPGSTPTSKRGNASEVTHWLSDS